MARERKMRASKLKPRLNQLMQEKGYNQKTLSEDSGVSRKTINELCNGKNENVRPDTLHYLAETLGVSDEYLIGSSDFINKNAEMLYNLDEELNDPHGWVVNAQIKMRFKEVFSFFNPNDYTAEELKELQSLIRKQIRMVLFEFINNHKKG